MPHGASIRRKIASTAPSRFALLVCAGTALTCGEAGSRGRLSSSEANLRIVDTRPAAGEVVDSARVFIDLCFSHRLDPASVNPDDVRLRSGFVFYDAELTLQLSNWLEAGSQSLAQALWCEGSVLRLAVAGNLPIGVSYRLVLNDGLRAWTGETLDTDAPGWVNPTPPDTDAEVDPADLEPTYVLDFRIAADAQVPEEPEVPEAISLESLFAADSVFDPAIARCSCHNLDGQLAHELLDLSDPSVAYAGLVEDRRLRSSGYPLVSVGQPAASFLIQKLVVHEGSSLPGVLGEPMPLGGDALEPALVGELARWIEAGALP